MAMNPGISFWTIAGFSDFSQGLKNDSHRLIGGLFGADDLYQRRQIGRPRIVGNQYPVWAPGYLGKTAGNDR